MELVFENANAFILASNTPSLWEQEMFDCFSGMIADRDVVDKKLMMVIHFKENEKDMSDRRYYFAQEYNVQTEPHLSSDIILKLQNCDALEKPMFRDTISHFCSMCWSDFQEEWLVEQQDSIKLTSEPLNWKYTFPMQWRSLFFDKNIPYYMCNTYPNVTVVEYKGSFGWLIDLPNFTYDVSDFQEFVVISGERKHPNTEDIEHFLYAFPIPDMPKHGKPNVSEQKGVVKILLTLN